MGKAEATGTLMAARRDASWHANPGHARYYHVKNTWHGLPVAACSHRILLDDRSAQSATETLSVLRCQRSGCKGRWPRVESPGGPVFNSADAEKSLSLHECSVAWAEHILRDYELDDVPWLVHSLAETMDEEALSAADHWLADHQGELENFARLPRWCPCGHWPDFGVGCWYHGPCKCVKRDGDRWHLLTYVDPEWRRFGYRQPVLTLGCPVHPDGPVPDEVCEARGRNGRSPESFVIGGERGLPIVPREVLSGQG